MTGKSQSEAVAVLRALALNSVVAVIVSRQIVDDTEVLAPPDTVTRCLLHCIYAQLKSRWLVR